MGCLRESQTSIRVVDELSNRYAFVLARHIEQVIDQGQLDRQRNRESVPESSAPIGGLARRSAIVAAAILRATISIGWVVSR